MKPNSLRRSWFPPGALRAIFNGLLSPKTAVFHNSGLSRITANFRAVLHDQDCSYPTSFLTGVKWRTDQREIVFFLYDELGLCIGRKSKQRPLRELYHTDSPNFSLKLVSHTCTTDKRLKALSLPHL